MRQDGGRNNAALRCNDTIWGTERVSSHPTAHVAHSAKRTQILHTPQSWRSGITFSCEDLRPWDLTVLVLEQWPRPSRLAHAIQEVQALGTLKAEY